MRERSGCVEMQTRLRIARRLPILVIVFVWVSLTMFGAKPAIADPPTIAGVVVNESNARLSNVTVAVLSFGSPVASTTTNVDGEFSVSVAAGVYDPRFTPPAGSGLADYLAGSHSAVAARRSHPGPRRRSHPTRPDAGASPAALPCLPCCRAAGATAPAPPTAHHRPTRTDRTGTAPRYRGTRRGSTRQTPARKRH
jgi:hypothetical protein